MMAKAKRHLNRHIGLVGYSLLVLAVTWALAWQYVLTQRIEEEAAVRSSQIEQQAEARAHIQCVRQNETRQEIGEILELLAAPRDNDTGQEFETRQELLEQTQELLLQEECPPDPLKVQEEENP